MSPARSQLFGLLLALATAIGCIFYEKLVAEFSYLTMMLIFLFELCCLCAAACFLFQNELPADYSKFVSSGKYAVWAAVYVLTGITSLLWYKITRTQGAMTSSIYEVKYIGMLAVLYALFGQRQFSINMGIGVMLAVGSLYFISKN